MVGMKMGRTATTGLLLSAFLVFILPVTAFSGASDWWPDEIRILKSPWIGSLVPAPPSFSISVVDDPRAAELRHTGPTGRELDRLEVFLKTLDGTAKSLEPQKQYPGEVLNNTEN
jgi:hypothetical protein